MDLFDEAACAALGVGRSDLRALNLLEDGPLGAGAIGRRLGLSKASVTALVDRLERSGYVARLPHPTDGRGVLVELRPETWRAFALVYRPLGRRVARTAADLPAPDRAAVAAALTRVAGAFDAARTAVAQGERS